MTDLAPLCGQLVEVSTTAELVTTLEAPGVIGVALDAAPPGKLAGTAAAAHPLPVLRPLWRRQRNARGEMDEVFDGYGPLTGMEVVRLADGELSDLT